MKGFQENTHQLLQDTFDAVTGYVKHAYKLVVFRFGPDTLWETLRNHSLTFGNSLQLQSRLKFFSGNEAW